MYFTPQTHSEDYPEGDQSYFPGRALASGTLAVVIVTVSDGRARKVTGVKYGNKVHVAGLDPELSVVDFREFDRCLDLDLLFAHFVAWWHHCK
jgi:hypothetical protein